MRTFDFTLPAELYTGMNGGFGRKSMKYHRFADTAQAIRFAMELLPPNLLFGTIVESGDERLKAADIRRLYESPSYPLERNKPDKLKSR